MATLTCEVCKTIHAFHDTNAHVICSQCWDSIRQSANAAHDECERLRAEVERLRAGLEQNYLCEVCFNESSYCECCGQEGGRWASPR